MSEIDDDIALLQARTLFVIGPGGTLEAVNDIDRPAPPRCFVSVTAGALRYWTPPDPAPGLVAALERWRAGCRPPMDLTTFTMAPQGVLDAALQPGVFCGPAYRFPATTDELAPDGGIRVRTCPPASGERLRATFPELRETLADRQPVVAAFDGEFAVAVCFSSRTSPEACEAGVETLPGHRGRGLASAVTTRWAGLVRAGGRTPLYSTSWENASSRGVAARLGLVRYAATMSLYGHS